MIKCRFGYGVLFWFVCFFKIFFRYEGEWGEIWFGVKGRLVDEF